MFFLPKSSRLASSGKVGEGNHQDKREILYVGVCVGNVGRLVETLFPNHALNSRGFVVLPLSLFTVFEKADIQRGLCKVNAKSVAKVNPRNVKISR
jgi:hypothetical protein